MEKRMLCGVEPCSSYSAGASGALGSLAKEGVGIGRLIAVLQGKKALKFPREEARWAPLGARAYRGETWQRGGSPNEVSSLGGPPSGLLALIGIGSCSGQFNGGENCRSQDSELDGILEII